MISLTQADDVTMTRSAKMEFCGLITLFVIGFDGLVKWLAL